MLTYSETTGRYVASTTRPNSVGFTYTDTIIEIELDAFAEFLNDASFPASWSWFEGNNPLLPTSRFDTHP